MNSANIKCFFPVNRGQLAYPSYLYGNYLSWGFFATYSKLLNLWRKLLCQCNCLRKYGCCRLWIWETRTVPQSPDVWIFVMSASMFVDIYESCLIGNSRFFQEFGRTHGRNNVKKIVKFLNSLFGIKVFKNGFIFCDFNQIVFECDIYVVTLSYIF